MSQVRLTVHMPQMDTSNGDKQADLVFEQLQSLSHHLTSMQFPLADHIHIPKGGYAWQISSQRRMFKHLYWH